MAKDTTTSTQEHLPISGIQDGVIIMNDSSVRMVLKVEPINFELKSETEQNAVIYSYQAFLNSLDFPIQIVIHSKKLDLEQYLVRIDKLGKSVTNELLQIQIEDYVGYLRRLISIANIMSKRFYVVVNYAAALKNTGVSSFSSLLHHQATGPLLDQETFTRYREEISNRANVIANGLGNLGLKVTALDTQQLIELFYTIYNPDIATEERLTDISAIESGLISAPANGGAESLAGITTGGPAIPPPAPAPAADTSGGLEERLQMVAENTSNNVQQVVNPEQSVTPPTQ